MAGLASSGNLSEVKIATIMALHYFKPLDPNGIYMVNKSYTHHAILNVNVVQSLLIMGIQVLVSKVCAYNHKILNHIGCVI